MKFRLVTVRLSFIAPAAFLFFSFASKADVFQDFLRGAGNTVNAGMTAVSPLAYTVTNGLCPGYDDAKAVEQIAKTETCSQAPSLTKQVTDLAQISAQITNNAEDRYFAALARETSPEMKCSADYAKNLATDKSLLADTQAKLLVLRELKKKITEASDIVTAPGNFVACPMRKQDLGSPEYDKNYYPCLALIELRPLYEAQLASIPLSNVASVRKFAEEFAGGESKRRLSVTQGLEAKISKAYLGAQKELLDQGKMLDELSAKTIATGVDAKRDEHRDLRRSLLSDPAIVNRALRKMGTDANIKGVACSADAKYGRGADNLDTALVVGAVAATVVTMGGSAIAEGSIGAAMVASSSAVRSVAAISATGLRVMQVAAISLDVSVAATQVTNQCYDASQMKFSAKALDDAGQCLSVPTVQQKAQDDCLMAGILSSASVAASIPMIANLVKTLKAGRPASEFAKTGAEASSLADDAAKGFKSKVASEQIASAQNAGQVRIPLNEATTAEDKSRMLELDFGFRNLVNASTDPAVQKAAMENWIKFRELNPDWKLPISMLEDASKNLQLPASIRELALQALNRDKIKFLDQPRYLLSNQERLLADVVEKRLAKLSKAQQREVYDSLVAGKGIPAKYQKSYIEGLALRNLNQLDNELSYLGYVKTEVLGKVVYTNPKTGATITVPNYRAANALPVYSSAERDAIRKALLKGSSTEVKKPLPAFNGQGEDMLDIGEAKLVESINYNYPAASVTDKQEIFLALRDGKSIPEKYLLPEFDNVPTLIDDVKFWGYEASPGANGTTVLKNSKNGSTIIIPGSEAGDFTVFTAAQEKALHEALVEGSSLTFKAEDMVGELRMAVGQLKAGTDAQKAAALRKLGAADDIRVHSPLYNDTMRAAMDLMKSSDPAVATEAFKTYFRVGRHESNFNANLLAIYKDYSLPDSVRKMAYDKLKQINSASANPGPAYVSTADMTKANEIPFLGTTRNQLKYQETVNANLVLKDMPGATPAQQKAVYDSLMAGKGVPEEFKPMFARTAALEREDYRETLRLMGFEEVQNGTALELYNVNTGQRIVLPTYTRDRAPLMDADMPGLRQALVDGKSYNFMGDFKSPTLALMDDPPTAATFAAFRKAIAAAEATMDSSPSIGAAQKAVDAAIANSDDFQKIAEAERLRDVAVRERAATYRAYQMVQADLRTYIRNLAGGNLARQQQIESAVDNYMSALRKVEDAKHKGSGLAAAQADLQRAQTALNNLTQN